MFNRFENLWPELDALSLPNSMYRDLENVYTSSGRAYHNLEHIKNCLDESDLIRNEVRDMTSLEFALWFHDIVCDSPFLDSSKNKEKSAEFTVQYMKSAGISSKYFRDKVKQLILATKYDEEPFSPSAAYMADLNLVSWGFSFEDFLNNMNKIRKEHASLSNDEFKEKMSSFLKKFLGKKTIFFTEFFRNIYEEQARFNLESTVRLLEN